jgi:predicted house-cleaning noncanonical NTP pyrophosphatase (MazG superfamily)
MGAETKYADGYPIKLVRDFIGERLGGEGTISYRPLTDPREHAQMLRAKLIEEAAEYVAMPSLAELADVLTVVEALAEIAHGVEHLDELHDEAQRKIVERGGFMRGMVMVGHHAADGRDLLPVPR